MLVVQVTYDPSVISYEQLLGTFWAHIDPTQKNGQGHDRGSQYRTGIYTHTPEQAEAAEQSRQKLQASLQVCLQQACACSRLCMPGSSAQTTAAGTGAHCDGGRGVAHVPHSRGLSPAVPEQGRALRQCSGLLQGLLRPHPVLWVNAAGLCMEQQLSAV